MAESQHEAAARPTGDGGLLDAIRVRTRVRPSAMRALRAMGNPPLMAPDGHVGPRTLEVGRDPLRILVLGGGLAVGYGVRTRAEAFDGPLARLVAERTGRGVVLENRAVQHVTLQRTVGSLGPAGTHTFHVAVWAPSFAEGMQRLRLASWRAALHRMITGLRAEDSAALVLTCLPVPAGHGMAALVARPWVQRLNRVIMQVAEEWDDVVAVETVPLEPAVVGKPLMGPAYFAAVAEAIVPAVVRLSVTPSALAAR